MCIGRKFLAHNFKKIKFNDLCGHMREDALDLLIFINKNEFKSSLDDRKVTNNNIKATINFSKNRKVTNKSFRDYQN